MYFHVCCWFEILRIQPSCVYEISSVGQSGQINRNTKYYTSPKNDRSQSPPDFPRGLVREKHFNNLIYTIFFSMLNGVLYSTFRCMINYTRNLYKV